MVWVHYWPNPDIRSIAGAKLVLPGPRLDADSLVDLCETEQVTFAAGVPTVWSDFLRRLDRGPAPRFPDKFEILTGGSAPHESLIRGLHRHGITMLQGWGLTESSGVLTVSRLKPQLTHAPLEIRFAYLALQGIPLPITQLRIVGEAGEELAWDGHSTGEIQVRGTSVTQSYLDQEVPGKWTDDNFFRTGDIGFVDELGYVRVLQRSEDLIKSGGEWIIPLEMEDAFLQDPAIQDCAVIAVQDAYWGERPLALVVLREGCTLDTERVRQVLLARFPKWWLPDEIITIDELPRTTVGKIARKQLRDRFQKWGRPNDT